jgi:hypothetical protein
MAVVHLGDKCFLAGVDVRETMVRAGYARDCPHFSGGRDILPAAQPVYAAPSPAAQRAPSTTVSFTAPAAPSNPSGGTASDAADAADLIS